jgi:hypothetical protein
MHCVARGENGYLRHIKYEDGFWGNWSEFRDIQIVGDPVIVCPLPGVLDLVVQVSGNEILGNRILRRRFTGGVWSAWSDTFGRTRDHIAALVQVDGTTHFLVRGTDNHLYEGVVNLDGTWAPWRDLGGTMLSRPHVIEVRENLLPRPSADAIGPAFAIPAGPYVCTLGMDGRTAARQSLNAVDWGAWAPFADGNAFIARPLIVTWKWGFPTAYPGLPLVEVANAGWIGRTAAEEIQVFAQFWREHEEAGSIVTLDTIGWKTFPPSMATDPIGLTMVDEDGSDRPWGFALKGDGRVHGADLVSPATLHSPIDWQPLFDGPADGEPALLILWERYEDAMLFRVVIVSADGRLQVLCGSNDNILPPFPPQVGPQPSRSRMIFPPPASSLTPGPSITDVASPVVGKTRQRYGHRVPICRTRIECNFARSRSPSAPCRCRCRRSIPH